MSNSLPGGWLIYACRSPYSIEVLEILWRCGDTVTAFVDNLADGPMASELAPVVTRSELTQADRRRSVAIPLLTPGFRYSVELEARTHGLSIFPCIVDPTSVVARTAALGEGSVINAQAVVAAGSKLGRFVHVNRSASLAHDLVVEDFVTLGPGCVVAGSVHIERGAFLGAGAVCAPDITIGANAVVGAGAVVVRDVSPGAVVVGNPASEIRRGDTGYGGGTVPDPVG